MWVRRGGGRSVSYNSLSAQHRHACVTNIVLAKDESIVVTRLFLFCFSLSLIAAVYSVLLGRLGKLSVLHEASYNVSKFDHVDPYRLK